MPLSTYPLLKRIVARARASPDSVATVDVPHSVQVTYGELVADIVALSNVLLSTPPAITQADLREARVAILLEKGYLVPLALLSTWAAGGFALPILPGLPLPEHAYSINNADCALIICDRANRFRAEDLVKQKTEGEECAILEISLEAVRASAQAIDPLGGLSFLDPIDGDRRAMMLYTSGTTGRPKGAVTRHSALAAQIESVVTAWRWQEDDNLLHILPLNHLHGICVALLPSLWAGAAVELWEKIDGQKVCPNGS